MSVRVRFVLVAVVAVVLASTLAHSAPTETTAKPRVSEDALETALADKRYLARQLKCALGEGPCDPVGKRLKNLAPLVLRGSCPECTPQEVKQIQKTLSHIQKNYPKEWRKILMQYAGF